MLEARMAEVFKERTGLDAVISYATIPGGYDQGVLQAETSKGFFKTIFSTHALHMRVPMERILGDALLALIALVPKPRKKIPVPTEHFAPRLLRRPLRIKITSQRVLTPKIL